MKLIDAEALKQEILKAPVWTGLDAIAKINTMPTIEAVPKEFHDKTCEAMAKRHQEEIADMVRVVRCKECKHWIGETEHYEDREYKACWQLCGQYMNSEFWCKYGEREGE